MPNIGDCGLPIQCGCGNKVEDGGVTHTTLPDDRVMPVFQLYNGRHSGREKCAVSWAMVIESDFCLWRHVGRRPALRMRRVADGLGETLELRMRLRMRLRGASLHSISLHMKHL
jgi:hypothetical protein